MTTDWLENGSRTTTVLLYRIRYFAILSTMKILFRTRDKNKLNTYTNTDTYTCQRTCAVRDMTHQKLMIYSNGISAIHERYVSASVCVRARESCGYKWLLYLVDLRLFIYTVWLFFLVSSRSVYCKYIC